jgi:SAM-dependent methyltransferase
MPVLPPGTMLQLKYLKERLSSLELGYFIEIGPGSGEITRLLLDLGWAGRSYDLEAKTVESLNLRFANEINAGRFEVLNENYLLAEPSKTGDLVISCMVMEHLEDDFQFEFMKTSAGHLKQGGVMIGIVPGSPAHWGIEDDIAGHCRRYTRKSIQELASACGWSLIHIVGLTFPISNLLLPISNFLVNRSEHSKLSLPILERTKQSGRREVKFKTHFPSLLRIVLNEYTIYPLHLIQKIFSKSEKALVIYFELTPISDTKFK